MVSRMVTALKEALWKGFLYALGSTVLVWLLLFGACIARYRLIGHTPDHIQWLAPHFMAWPQALEKAAHIASVSGVIMFGFAVAAILVMNLLGWVILGIFLLFPKRTSHH